MQNNKGQEKKEKFIMKKLLASLMALSMVFAVTGCSESNDSENESKAEAKTTTTTTTAAPAVESKADTTTTTAAPEESVADTTTSADDTTSTGDEAKGTYENDVYTSDLYTFKIDSKKWAMQESAGVDVMFTYADAGDDAELESASINVISMSNDLLNGLTASEYADQIKQTYNSMEFQKCRRTETDFVRISTGFWYEESLLPEENKK